MVSWRRRIRHRLVMMAGSDLLAEVGPIRLLQLGLLLSACGLLLALLGFWPLTLLAAQLIGLGYGPAPAGNQLLMNTPPEAHRSLIFSIKRRQSALLSPAFSYPLLPTA